MSFGVSITDIIALGQLTHEVYKRWHAACGDYAKITADLALLKTFLRSVQDEAESSNSVLSKYADDVAQWRQLSKRCTTTVRSIGDVLDKYKDLKGEQTVVARWQRIQVVAGNELQTLGDQLVETRRQSLILPACWVSRARCGWRRRCCL